MSARVLWATAAVVAATAIGYVVAGRSAARNGDSAKPNDRARPPVEQIAPKYSPPVERPQASKATGGVRFHDMAAALGCRFRYERGDSGTYWLPETMGGGAAWFDLDGDGWLDLYFSQGLRQPPGGNDAVRWSHGGRRFVEVPPHALPPARAYGMGVAAGDFNNDGFDDICATDVGAVRLLANNGDGTFSETSANAGVRTQRWTTSAAFGDLDGDGDLDLVVGAYVVYENRKCTDTQTGAQRYCGPDVFPGDACELYRNLGDGRFRDESATSGIGKRGAKALGVAIARLDDRGRPAVFVANDLVENFLFANRTNDSDSALRFDECAVERNVAGSGDGVRQANMGVACGDYDNDGRLDLFCTHYYNEHDTLWRNLGPVGFRDSTKAARLYVPTLTQLSWGTQFLDADNDGWLDLFVTSGHINRDNGGAVPYEMPAQFFANRADDSGRRYFTELGADAGEHFAKKRLGRGSAAGDFDRDGRVDLAVVHHRTDVALLHNRSAAGNAVSLEFVGETSPRDGGGVRVRAYVAGRESPLMREIVGGGSYLSNDARRIVLGGVGDSVLRLVVEWPSGRIDEHLNLAARRHYLLREGREAPVACTVCQP